MHRVSKTGQDPPGRALVLAGRNRTSHLGEAGRHQVQNVRMRNVQAGTWWTTPSGAGGHGAGRC
jgi:hypothetical protein